MYSFFINLIIEETFYENKALHIVNILHHFIASNKRCVINRSSISIIKCIMLCIYIYDALLIVHCD